jgi:hypothetical protein
MNTKLIELTVAVCFAAILATPVGAQEEGPIVDGNCG